MAERVLHFLVGGLLEHFARFPRRPRRGQIFAKYVYLMCAIDSPAKAASRFLTVTDSGFMQSLLVG